MTAKKEKLWSRLFIFIALATFMTGVSAYGLNNGIPLYIDSIGGATEISGVLVGTFAFAAAFGRLLGGNLSDRVGRRRIMLAGAAAFCVSAFLPVLLTDTGTLIAFRALHGLSFAAVTTAAAGAAADIVPRSRLGEGIGYFGLANSLVNAAGPAFGIALFNLGGHDTLFAGAAAAVFVSLVLSYFCRYEADLSRTAGIAAEADAPKPRLLWRIFEKNALVPASMILLFTVALSILLTFMALYATQQGYRSAGLFFIIQAAAMILMRLTAGRLFDSRPALMILLPAQAIGVLSFLLLALSNNELLFYACGFLSGLSFGVIFPLLNSVAVKRTPPRRWGAANATFYLCCDIGIGFGSMFWGALIDAAHSYIPVFLGGALCMVLVAVIGVLTLRRRKDRLPDELNAAGGPAV
jgi:MFS family permease